MSSASLWSKYSMLKSTLLVHENINISGFTKVIAFLKKCNIGYESNKSKIFTREEVNKFMKEAPNDEYLLTKVSILIIAHR